MTDHDFESLIRDTAAGYRVPPEPPLDRMWDAIEARAFPPLALRRGRPRWFGPLAFAATLLLGVSLGVGGARLWSPAALTPIEPPVEPPGQLAAGDAVEPSPFVGVASDYLQRTTALLVTMSDDSLATLLPATVARARDLLSTTRLLLDSGVESPALRELLQDLELVLAQVVRLPQSPAGGDDGAHFVSEAVAQRDVLPRLTLLLADARSGRDY
jgi:hypothetical protein